MNSERCARTSMIRRRTRGLNPLCHLPAEVDRNPASRALRGLSRRTQHPRCLAGNTNETEVLQDGSACVPSISDKVTTTQTLGFLGTFGYESAIQALSPVRRTDASSK